MNLKRIDTTIMQKKLPVCDTFHYDKNDMAKLVVETTLLSIGYLKNDSEQKLITIRVGVCAPSDGLESRKAYTLRLSLVARLPTLSQTVSAPVQRRDFEGKLH